MSRSRSLFSMFAVVTLAACAVESEDDGGQSQSAALLATGDTTTLTVSPTKTTTTTTTTITTRTGTTTTKGTGYTKPLKLVTSPDCPKEGVLVAQAERVRAVAPGFDKSTLSNPIGKVLTTSSGPMYSLLDTRDTGITRPTRVNGKPTGRMASILEINAVKRSADGTFATFICAPGNDGTGRVDSGAQLSDVTIEVADPVTFVPKNNNFYPDDIYSRQFWAGYFDPMIGDYVAADEHGVGWFWIWKGSTGPFYNARNAYMVDALGNATDRYAVVVHDYLALVVYRPDAYKVSASTYAPEFGGVGGWAPPVRTTIPNTFTNY